MKPSNSYDVPKEIMDFFDYLDKTYKNNDVFIESKKPLNNIYKVYKQLLSKNDLENEELRKITALHYLISL